MTPYSFVFSFMIILLMPYLFASMQTELNENDNSAVIHSGETTIEYYNVFCFYSNLILVQKLFDFLKHSSSTSINICGIEQCTALFGYHIFDFFVLPEDVPMKQVSRSKTKQFNSLEFQESKISKDDIVGLTNEIAYRFSKDLLAFKYPEADPLEEIIRKSLLFIESKKEEINMLLNIVENEDVFRTRLVHFLSSFNLLHEGVLSMPNLDLFILHYIRFSFKTEILEKSLILPDDERGIHFLEKSCIPLPEMDLQITLPILNLKHQYYCYIFEKYPLIISLCSYFPEAPVPSFQRYDSHICRTSQVERDIVIKLLVANIIDEAQRLFDEMSKYEQNIFLIDEVEIASLRDLEGNIAYLYDYYIYFSG